MIQCIIVSLIFSLFAYNNLSAQDSTWVILSRTSGTTIDGRLSGLCYGNDLFVAVGTNGIIRTSPDGIAWTSRSSGYENDLNGVSYGNDIYVAVGSGGRILTSPDGITWTQRAFNSMTSLGDIVYGNHLFVTVGNPGIVKTSPNGIDWTSRSSGTTTDLRGVTYGNNQFVAVGDEVASKSTLLTSSNGIDWTSRITGTDRNILAVVYANNQFVAVGAYGRILTSTDCVEWSSRSSGTSSILYSITYGNSKFLIVGSNGTILTSSDAIGWTSINSGTTDHISDIVYVDGQFFTVGHGGSILQISHRKKPMIATDSLKTAISSVAYSDTVLCTHDQLFPISWSLLEYPSGMTIVPETGIMLWTPTLSQGGSHTVKIRLTDGDLNDTATFTIYVITENRPPRITTVFPNTLQQGNLYIIPLSAVDREGDSIKWTIVNMPANMSRIDTNLVWAPTSAQVGEDSVIIVASDGNGSDTLIARYAVLPTTGNERSIPIPTVFSLSATPNPFNPTTTLTIGIPELDKSPVSVKIFSINGELMRESIVQGTGYHKLVWNARDGKNTSIASNMFVVVATNGKKVLQQKILLLK